MNVKRKILAAALACIMTVGLIPTNALAAIDVSPSVNADVSAHATLDGDGSESNPYKIEDAADLKEFAATVNDGELSACAELTSNIDLNPSITFNADGSYSGGTPDQWTVIEDYKGVFNGNSKTIRGLYIHNEESYQGLFGENTGTIKNLGVIESYVSAGKDYTNGGYVGSIVGRNGDGTVENCYNTGYVNGTNNVGGVAGYTYGSILNCYNTGDITSSGNTVGGVAGHSATSLTDSYNTGTVTGGADSVGGVTGSNKGIVKNCYNTGKVIGTGDFSWETNVGGISGCCGTYSMAGKIENCYNSGEIIGNNALTGGVTGRIEKRGEVVNCYNTGSVKSAAFAGGIAGENSHGTLKSCHNTGTVQGEKGEGAIAGNLMGTYTVENTYYLFDAETEDGGRTEAQFASGEVAWQLNENQSAQVWRQNIDNREEKDHYPVLSGGDVYQVNQYSTCDKSDIPVKAYSNTNADILGAHNAVQHVDAKAATSTENGNIEYWYCADCEKYFADEALTEEISHEQTVIPAVKPSDYFFSFQYVDGEGNPVYGGGVIYFDKIGPYSREDIPLPDGYMQITPAHPGEDWLYPTALEFVNGKWVVTNQDVEIMVEPMAKVDIIFKTPDGKVLEDFSYIKYYDSIGAGIETVTAPDGYEFVGENTYAVDVTRDENGKLVADPAEVMFWVKAVGTEIPVNPSDYSFTVKYVDGEGNPIQGGGTITFDKAGSYSREDIPLPYGYMEIVPAHPDNDWMYPTALEWKDGQWFVTNPVVEIMVEPMATVNIIFKTPDGKVLEDFSYIKYYDSEGGGIETVTAPEGYEFVGENTYAVDVTRDENGKLVADPTEVEFVVKAIGSGEPSEPEDPSKPSEPSEPTEPEKPTTPTQPGDDAQSPETGDSSNLNLGVALMGVSALAICIVLITNRRKKEIE